MKDIYDLLAKYDAAIRDVVRAEVGDDYRKGSKVNKAQTRLAKARKDLAEYFRPEKSPLSYFDGLPI